MLYGQVSPQASRHWNECCTASWAMIAQGKKLKVLMVSSDKTALDATSQLLVAEQCELCQTGEANEALLTLLDQDIDVVILDSTLSVGNGLELAPIIKRLRPRTNLIVLFDDQSIETMQKVIGCGFVYHAMKPVNESEMVEVVKAIRKRLYRRESEEADGNF